MRRPAVGAGTFYPIEPLELARVVDELLACAAPRDRPPRARGAIVVPHAGYAYSGPIAASAYATLTRHPTTRVVVLGPSHFVPLLRIAVPETEAWQTPLGDVVVDDALRSAAIGAGAVVDDRPHRREHAVEVQLPFLARALGGTITVLPLAVGDVPPGLVADLLEILWASADLIVVSTDLSHYLDHASAQRIDRRTAAAVLARDPDAIADGAACGAHALRGIVELARRHALEVRLLDLRTSADTAGDPGCVVGYGAFSIDP
ncbi:MAG: AmmeMemoRadiSam system protein B [Actinomycetota bacterium]